MNTPQNITIFIHYKGIHFLYLRIQFKFGDTWGPVHGDNVTSFVTEVYLQHHEYVDQVTKQSGWVLDGLKFTAQTGRDLGIHGHVPGGNTPTKRVFAFMTGKQCLGCAHGNDALCSVKLKFLYPF